MTDHPNRVAVKKRNAKRWAGAAGCIGAAAALAAHAANATFGGAASVAETGSTSAADLYLTVPGAGSTNRMTLTVDNLYPANIDNSTPWRERAVDVANAGNIDFETYTISSVANTSNHLSAAGSAGALMIIDECSQTWTEGGTASEPTYTCGGTSHDVLGCASCGGGIPVDYAITPNVTSSYTWTAGSSNPSLSNITMTHGVTNHLRFRFKLATNASNAAQGQSVNVTFTFDGTQRGGTSA